MKQIQSLVTQMISKYNNMPISKKIVPLPFIISIICLILDELGVGSPILVGIRTLVLYIIGSLFSLKDGISKMSEYDKNLLLKYQTMDKAFILSNMALLIIELAELFIFYRPRYLCIIVMIIALAFSSFEYTKYKYIIWLIQEEKGELVK